MDKDEFLKLKLRENFVKAMLDKISLMSIDDFQLIPALEEYVLTGNKEMFCEFYRFHSNMDMKEKIKLLESERNELVEKSQSVINSHEKEQELYDGYVENYKKWVDTVMKKLDDFDSLKFTHVTLKDLRSFLERNKDAVNELSCLYVKDGEKLKSVGRVEIIQYNGKYRVVLSSHSDAWFFSPRRPQLCPPVHVEDVF